jgi:hypothetical protein
MTVKLPHGRLGEVAALSARKYVLDQGPIVPFLFHDNTDTGERAASATRRASVAVFIDGGSGISN